MTEKKKATKTLTPKSKTLIQSLIQARKDFGAVIKDATGQAGQHKFDYASINSIIDAVEGPLLKNGLFLSQPVIDNQVHTVIYHENGECISFGAVSLMGASDPKTQGAAITYARRYGLQTCLLLKTSEKEDLDQSPSNPSYNYAAIGKKVQSFSENSKNFLKKRMSEMKSDIARKEELQRQLRIIHDLNYDEDRAMKRIQN